MSENITCGEISQLPEQLQELGLGFSGEGLLL